MSATQARGHIFPLTSLRFVAAAMIVALHLSGKLGLPDFRDTFPYGSGVSFFYVLSGFILTYVYYRPDNKGWPKQKFFEFIKKRFRRLYPLHIATLILICVFVPSVLNDLSSLPYQLTLTQSWFGGKSTAFSYNAPAWSISTEMGFYILFPFFLLLYKRIGAVFLLLMTATLTGVLVLNNVAPDLKWLWELIQVHPLCRLFEFVCGIWIAKLFLTRPDIKGSTLSFTIFEAISILCVLIFGLMIAKISTTSAYSVIGDDLYNSLKRVGLLPFFAFLIWVFSYSRGYISKILSWRPFVFLGEISFAIYLVHQIVIRALTQRPEMILGAPLSVVLMGVLGVTFSISTLLYLGIEKPFIKHGLKNIREVIKQSLSALKRRTTALYLGILAISLILPLTLATGIYPSKNIGPSGLGEGSVRVNLKSTSDAVSLRSHKIDYREGGEICIYLLWEFSSNISDKKLSRLAKEYFVDEEGQNSFSGRNNKVLLIPKKIDESKYPIQIIDKFCQRKNYENWNIQYRIIPDGENAIKFPHGKRVRPYIEFRKTEDVVLMNTEK